MPCKMILLTESMMMIMITMMIIPTFLVIIIVFVLLKLSNTIEIIAEENTASNITKHSLFC